MNLVYHLLLLGGNGHAATDIVLDWRIWPCCHSFWKRVIVIGQRRQKLAVLSSPCAFPLLESTQETLAARARSAGQHASQMTQRSVQLLPLDSSAKRERLAEMQSRPCEFAGRAVQPYGEASSACKIDFQPLNSLVSFSYRYTTESQSYSKCSHLLTCSRFIFISYSGLNSTLH